jgi:hypothetical protein
MKNCAVVLTPEEISEIIQRDTRSWEICNKNFLEEIGQVVAIGQSKKILREIDKYCQNGSHNLDGDFSHKRRECSECIIEFKRELELLQKWSK